MKSIPIYVNPISFAVAFLSTLLIAQTVSARSLNLKYSGSMSTKVSLDLSAGGDNPLGKIFNLGAGAAGCNKSLSETGTLDLQLIEEGNRWKLSSSSAFSYSGIPLEQPDLVLNSFNLDSGQLSLGISYTVMQSHLSTRASRSGNASAYCAFSGPVEQSATVTCTFDKNGGTSGKSCTVVAQNSDELNPINISSSGNLSSVSVNISQTSSGTSNGGPTVAAPTTIQQLCDQKIKNEEYRKLCLGTTKSFDEVKKCVETFAPGRLATAFGLISCISPATNSNDFCRRAYVDLPVGSEAEQKCLASSANADGWQKTTYCALLMESPFSKFECAEKFAVSADSANACLTDIKIPYGELAGLRCIEGNSRDFLISCGKATGVLSQQKIQMCSELGIERASACAKAFGNITPNSLEHKLCLSETPRRLKLCADAFSFFTAEKMECIQTKQTSDDGIEGCNTDYLYSSDKLNCIRKGGPNPRLKFCSQMYTNENDANNCVQNNKVSNNTLGACTAFGFLGGDDCIKYNKAAPAIQSCREQNKFNTSGALECIKKADFKSELYDSPGLTDKERNYCGAKKKCFESAVKCLGKSPEQKKNECLQKDVYQKSF